MSRPRHASSRAAAAPGRPRSADATLAVRAAALALADEGGAQFATVERIAARSGVAKATIYRRWPNAASIVMDAFLAEIEKKAAYRRKATVEETFTASVLQLVASFKGTRGELLRHILGAAQSDPQLQQAFQDNWVAPRRAEGLAVIADAQAEGALAADVDADVLLDAIYGAMYYRLMIPYKELSPAFAKKMVRQVFEGVLGPRQF